MEIVLDASAAARALMPGGTTLLRKLRATRCHAPHLLDAEVGSVLRGAAALGATSPHSAQAALYALESLVTDRYPHVALVRAAWRLRDDLTYYDALYVALADRLGLPLLTADARLARCPGLSCAVELVD